METDSVKNSIRGLPKKEALKLIEQICSIKQSAITYLYNKLEDDDFSSLFLNAQKIPKNMLYSPVSKMYEITENLFFNKNNKIYTFYNGAYEALCEVEEKDDGTIVEKAHVKEDELDYVKISIKKSRDIVKKYINTKKAETFEDSPLWLDRLSKDEANGEVKRFEKELSEINNFLKTINGFSDLSFLLLDIASLPEKDLEKESQVFELYDLSSTRSVKLNENKKGRLFYLRDKNKHTIFVKQSYNLIPVYSVKFNAYGDIVEKNTRLDSVAVTVKPEDVKNEIRGFFESAFKEFEQYKLNEDIKNGRQKTLDYKKK